MLFRKSAFTFGLPLLKSLSIPSETRPLSLASLLLLLKEKWAPLFAFKIPPSFPLRDRPRPPPPLFSTSPPRYFFKGTLNADPQKNPPPIPYLLIETYEIAQPRPVPGNSLLLRSLCKGKGILKQNKQGLIYLDIDNRFISAFFPYLKAYNLVRPPYFNLFSTPKGAHIPVIPAREASLHYLDAIKEIGKEFSFEIEGLYSLEPTLWPEVEQVWFFKIHSPELEELRRRYFLTEKPGGHSFSIAVAIKPHPFLAKQPFSYPMMRINIAFLAA